jgi:hypothetical protein
MRVWRRGLMDGMNAGAPSMACRPMTPRRGRSLALPEVPQIKLPLTPRMS